jgi:hypothetical protein
MKIGLLMQKNKELHLIKWLKVCGGPEEA